MHSNYLRNPMCADWEREMFKILEIKASDASVNIIKNNYECPYCFTVIRFDIMPEHSTIFPGDAYGHPDITFEFTSNNPEIGEITL